MNDEVLSLRVICGRGFESTHKGSMTQLCLSICADDFQLLGHGQPLGLLLWRSLGHQCWDEHLHWFVIHDNGNMLYIMTGCIRGGSYQAAYADDQY